MCSGAPRAGRPLSTGGLGSARGDKLGSVDAGEAVVGNIGSDDRMKYRVLGPAVNLAARLESLNKSYDTAVLVSEAVAQRAAGSFAFRQVDTIRPKGFAGTVRVFELVSDANAAPICHSIGLPAGGVPPR
jgi:adenylate cyclase